MFWILEKTDGAILGLASGSQSQRVIEGPFESWDDAFDVKRGYRRYGCTYYTVVESAEEPTGYKKSYEFVDAHYEFEDC